MSAPGQGAGYSFPWEQAAMRGDELPDNLPLPDQMAYTAMRNIYRAYHQKSISRDKAVAEKRKIRRTYEQARETLAFEGRLAKHMARLMKDTEAARTACRKEPTAENALRLCAVMEGMGGAEV